MGGKYIVGAVTAVIAFVIIANVISTSVTGTDTGSVLIQTLGTLVAAFVTILALLGGVYYWGKGR